ncbi:MAG: crossover junction endodeoxyribonuclease RuvC [Sulfuriflexus sp.]|nr:crossover junction endodeoxyribonuclease RuvC [Sulfuriflexus sp.]
MVRILGIDPGSRITGYGVIDVEGNQSRYVTSGCIRITSDDWGQRLGTIFVELGTIIREFNPHEFAVEQVFMHRNADSALKLGQARGAAICAGVAHDLQLSEYAARAIKQAVVGKGGASKDQVQHMVKVLLNLNASPQEDAADALAVALCHAHTAQTLAQLPAAGKKQARRRS